MHMKNAVTALVALSAVSDAAILQPRKSPFSRSLKKRQFGGGDFGGGNDFFNGGNNDGGNDFFDGNNDGQDDNQDDGQDNGQDDGQDDNFGGGGGGQLDPNVIQDASASDGGPQDGQAASATDDSNFINFCQGLILTNGQQNEGGSCNGIPMGNIPGTGNMVASVFTSPQNGDDLQADTDFTISVQMINFAPGTFTNPDNTYYAAPQDVDGNGNIIGHTHVTVQDTGGDTNPTQPLDPTQFVFFKGINDQGDGNGLLSADVEGGLPTGNYRLCSMAAAANHQPVIMPVAQRGAQDDCIRFTVGAGNGGDNGDGQDDGQDDGGNNFFDDGQQDDGQDDQNQDDGQDNGGNDFFGGGGDQFGGDQSQDDGGNDFFDGGGDNQFGNETFRRDLE